MLATLLTRLAVLASWGGRAPAPAATAAEIRSRTSRQGRIDAAADYGYWWTVSRGF